MIDSAIRKAAEKEGCNVCLIIIPRELKNQYKKLKKSALLKYKIICQMTTDMTIKNKNFKSIATKILLQILAKRGNTLWVPRLPDKLPPTMLIGF